MNIEEYDKVKNYTYLEYCDYLQGKYGIGLSDYMTKSWNGNKKCKRASSDGLIAHHKYEDHAIMLSTKQYAMKNPFEWQVAKNIVYCDYLEHLLLHILICEYPAKDRNPNESVGVGGVINYIVPELNDFYSGWQPKKTYQQKCFGLVTNDKDVYFKLLKKFMNQRNNYLPLAYEEASKSPLHYLKHPLCSSDIFHIHYDAWTQKNNIPLFEEILNYLGTSKATPNK